MAPSAVTWSVWFSTLPVDICLLFGVIMVTNLGVQHKGPRGVQRTGTSAHALSLRLTYLAVLGGEGLTEAPHDMCDVSDDVLQGREDVLQLLLEGCCIIHIGSPWPILLALQQHTEPISKGQCLLIGM